MTDEERTFATAAEELADPEFEVDDEAPTDEASAIDVVTAVELEPADRQALLTALLFAGGEIVDGLRLGAYFSLAPLDLELLAEESSAALRPLGLDIVHT